MQLKEKPLLLKAVLIICFQVYVLAVVGIEVVFKYQNRVGPMQLTEYKIKRH